MIEVDETGGRSLLRINRPEKAGALTEGMLTELASAVEKSRTHALILTGTVSVFSAGADLDDAKKGLAISPAWERLSGAISAYSGLTIAALNGTVAGGAMGMVLACDIRLGVPHAKAFYPVMRLGFLPQPSDPKRLAHLVGPARAKIILMCGEKIDAQRAYDWGLFDEIVPEDQLLDRANALATDCTNAAPNHLRAIKEMCQGSKP